MRLAIESLIKRVPVTLKILLSGTYTYFYYSGKKYLFFYQRLYISIFKKIELLVFNWEIIRQCITEISD